MENEERTRQVNLEIAVKKTTLPMIIMILFIIYSAIGLIVGHITFNLIFGVITLFFIFIARNRILKNDVIRSKRYIIYSIIIDVFSLLFDILLVCLTSDDPMELFYFMDHYFWIGIFKVSYVGTVFSIVRVLSKAGNPIKYRESTDWFYEKYDDKK